MKLGAFIPARIGSKRLKRKNIKMLCGKPLICWTIDVILEADVFHDVTVSTESQEIIDIVRQYYSQKDVKILLRPEELSEDDAPLFKSEHHYLNNRPELEWYGTFMATFPFRKSERLREAYRNIITRYPWKVISISQREYCSFDYYYPVNGGFKRFFEIPPIYVSSGSPVYNLNHRCHPNETWGRYGIADNERLFKIHVDQEELIDIDTHEDFLLAEKIASGKRLKPIKLCEYDIDDWYVVVPDGVDLDKVLEAIGREKLDDLTQPLLILEPARPFLSFLRLHDGNTRNYWISDEAYMYLKNKDFVQTCNSTYCPTHYRHSDIYRFIRKYKKNGHIMTDFHKDSDLRGILYGMGDGVGNGPESVISKDRVILIDDLIQKGLPEKAYCLE